MPAYYWVPGGNGFWSSSSNWALSSGGTPGAGVPIGFYGDDANFDSNSGSGVVTTSSSGNGSTAFNLNTTGFAGSINGTDEVIVYGSNVRVFCNTNASYQMRATTTNLYWAPPNNGGAWNFAAGSTTNIMQAAYVSNITFGTGSRTVNFNNYTITGQTLFSNRDASQTWQFGTGKIVLTTAGITSGNIISFQGTVGYTVFTGTKLVEILTPATGTSRNISMTSISSGVKNRRVNIDFVAFNTGGTITFTTGTPTLDNLTIPNVGAFTLAGPSTAKNSCLRLTGNFVKNNSSVTFSNFGLNFCDTNGGTPPSQTIQTMTTDASPLTIPVYVTAFGSGAGTPELSIQNALTFTSGGITPGGWAILNLNGYTVTQPSFVVGTEASTTTVNMGTTGKFVLTEATTGTVYDDRSISSYTGSRLFEITAPGTGVTKTLISYNRTTNNIVDFSVITGSTGGTIIFGSTSASSNTQWVRNISFVNAAYTASLRFERLYGSFEGVSSVTYTFPESQYPAFYGSDARNLSTGGQLLPWGISLFNSTGNVNLTGAVGSTSGMTLQQNTASGSTLNTNNYNITGPSIQLGRMTINAGTTKFTVTSINGDFFVRRAAESTVFNFSPTAEIIFTGGSGGNKFLRMDYLSFPIIKQAGDGPLWFSFSTVPTNNQTINIVDLVNVATGATTFNIRSLPTVGKYLFANFNLSGASAGARLSLRSQDAANSYVFEKTSGTIVSNFLDIQRSTAQGGATWYAGSSSIDSGNNSGWIFSGPPSSEAFFMILGMR